VTIDDINATMKHIKLTRFRRHGVQHRRHRAITFGSLAKAGSAPVWPT
jgi:hypothetical protein